MKKMLRAVVGCFILVPIAGYAAHERTIVSLSAELGQPITVTSPSVSLSIQDQYFPYTNPTSTFKAVDAHTYAILRWDDHDRTATVDRWNLSITYSISYYTNSGTLLSTLTGESLSISYDPREGHTYNDKDLKDYASSYKAKLTITAISFSQTNPSNVTTTGSAVPAWLGDVYLDLEEDVERYYDMSTGSFTLVNFTDLPATNELHVDWNYFQGAESYDVEWVFVDAGAQAVTDATLKYDFSNATRVNVPNNTYDISLAFPKGILLVRVRPVGVNWAKLTAGTPYIVRSEGAWSYTPSSTTLNPMSPSVPAGIAVRKDISTGMLETMNWSYQAAFAEDGKRMEAASFADGVMKNRQSVTRINTDSVAIISESRYDYEGRPAVGLLPVPLSGADNQGLVYYPLQNYGFDRPDYDENSTLLSPASVPAYTATGTYYSSSNTKSGAEDYTPDGGGYPYGRVLYTNDGTSRVRRASGPGSDFKIGSGKESKFYYGTPTGQVEIDRLFGNEVGSVKHYKKNLAVDANGNVSVSYLDQEGRVIATALAGDPPANLLEVDNPNTNPNTTISLNADLLGNNNLNQDGEMVSEQTLVVSSAGPYSFNYTLGTPDQYCTTTCAPDNFCADCKYDLEIRVLDENGILATNLIVGSCSPTNSSPATGEYPCNPIRATAVSSGTYTFDALFPVGEFHIQKILKLNEASVQTALAAFMESDCNDFNAPALTTTCPGSCEEACEQLYKRADGESFLYFDENGDPTDESTADSLIDVCEANLCGHPVNLDPCELHRQAMRDDMSPGGQYFDNTPQRIIYVDGSNVPTSPNDPMQIPTDDLNPSYDRNGWLTHDATMSTNMLAAINAVHSTSYVDWDDVRAHWEDAFADVMVTFHPEYCTWQYYCSYSCSYTLDGVPDPVSVDMDDVKAYEDIMMYHTDGNYSGTDQYLFDPVGVTQSTSTSGQLANNTGYQPYPVPGNQYRDPLFVGNCDFDVCEDPTVSAEVAIQNYLSHYLTFTVSSTTYSYSIWYVINDPDNIAGSPSGSLPASVVGLFQTLHSGSTALIADPPGAGQVSSYQYFYAAYNFYRQLLRDQGLADDATHSSCVSANWGSSIYDAEGFLLPGTLNPVTTSGGFTIQYPRPLDIDLYGDGCSAPSASALADNISDWVDAQESAANSMSQPAAVPSNTECTCHQVSDFLAEQGLTWASSNTDIIDAVYDGFGITVVSSDIDDWRSVCDASPITGDLSDMTNLPEDMVCGDFLPDVNPDGAAAAAADCQSENDIAAQNNADDYNHEQQTLAAQNYIAAFRAHCIQQMADIEQFSVEYYLREYMYTLYYYDQAGNLVKTIPPEGVNLIAVSSGDYSTGGTYWTANPNIPYTVQDVADFRAGTSSTFVPAIHDMKNLYAYNSLQQQTQASLNESGNTGIYESGTTTFWYDYLGRMILSQNSQQAQATPKKYSYVDYDVLGRTVEVGEISDASGTFTANVDQHTRQNHGDYYWYNGSSQTAFEDWRTDASNDPSRRTTTHTYYDEVPSFIALGDPVDAAFSNLPGGQQSNLRNRVAAIVYDDDPTAGVYSNLYGSSSATEAPSGHEYQHGIFYSYDIHGNVQAMVEETPALEVHDLSIKTVSYEYDLISGNVNAVHYQTDQLDAMHHKYEYDADNRLKVSYSSRDQIIWEKESKQIYSHGDGTSRMELGDKTVQGTDVVSTIQGWLKAINRNTMVTTSDPNDAFKRDIGKDAYQPSEINLNRNMAADAFGEVLGYYTDANGGFVDYTPVDQAATGFGTADYFEAAGKSGSTTSKYTKASTSSPGTFMNQYNGNIAAMSTAMLDDGQQDLGTIGRNFQYDALYRLKQSTAYFMDATAGDNNAWQTTYTQDHRYEENFSYDWNGNIREVARRGNVLSSGTATYEDQLTYKYDPAGNTNILLWIDDLQNDCDYDDDLDDQSSGNYDYDKTGQLTKDESQRITSIEWDAYHRVVKVHKDQTVNMNTCPTPDVEYDDADIEFMYNAAGQRLCKIVKPHTTGTANCIHNQSRWIYTWYTYDAGGNVMGVYEQKFAGSSMTYTMTMTLKELDLYGAGRLGIRHGDETNDYWTQTLNLHAALSGCGNTFDVSSTGSVTHPASPTHYVRVMGMKEYELHNHLGNVQVTISDKRIAQDIFTYTAGSPNSGPYILNTVSGLYEYVGYDLSLTPLGDYSQSGSADGTADYYNPDVVSYSDYYAFGAPLPGRTGGLTYRYGFNGVEQDPEIKGNGNSYAMDFRMYDSRVGRWLSKDPIIHSWESPYVGFANNPIIYTDPSGLAPGNGSKVSKVDPDQVRGFDFSAGEPGQNTTKGMAEIVTPTSGASSEWKAFIESWSPDDWQNYVNDIYQKKLEPYQKDGISALVYGTSYGSTSIPESIYEQKEEEANQEAMPLLKGAWACKMANYDPNSFWDCINPIKLIRYYYWKALTVSSRDEGKALVSEVLVTTATSWVLHFVGGGASNLIKTPTTLVPKRISASALASASDLAKFPIGQGFTGIYDEATGKLLWRASNRTAADIALPDGKTIVTDVLLRGGGHRILLQELGGDVSSKAGFAMEMVNSTTINLKWESGTINLRRFGGSRILPVENRAAVIEAVQKEFPGYKITQDK